MEDTCIFCGEYVTEGYQICKLCEKDPLRTRKNKKGKDKENEFEVVKSN